MVESLGHIDFKWYVDRFTTWLEQQGDADGCYAAQDTLLSALSARSVKGRKVLDAVLAQVKERRDSLASGARGTMGGGGRTKRR